jgi:hypothetical protein
MWDFFALLLGVGASFLGIGAVLALYLSARDAGTRIAEATERASHADARAATANERASSADERAAALEKDAAQLRLDLEREREKRLGRALTKEQFDALQMLKGKVTRANIMWENNTEVMSFAGQIIHALDQAGVNVRVYFSPPGTVLTGIMIWSPKRDDDPLMAAFQEAGFLPGWGNISVLQFPDVPHDVPLIQMGERFLETKPPYFGPPPP